MKTNCNLCNKDRFRFGNGTVIPVYYQGIFSIPHGLNTEIFYLCLECGLGFLAQEIKLNTKDIEEYLEFIG